MRPSSKLYPKTDEAPNDWMAAARQRRRRSPPLPAVPWQFHPRPRRKPLRRSVISATGREDARPGYPRGPRGPPAAADVYPNRCGHPPLTLAVRRVRPQKKTSGQDEAPFARRRSLPDNRPRAECRRSGKPQGHAGVPYFLYRKGTGRYSKSRRVILFSI